MMTSSKEQWRQQISDYEILFIKGGWLVDKSKRPLPFVSQENRGRGGGVGICHPTMTTKVKNTPRQIGLISSSLVLLVPFKWHNFLWSVFFISMDFMIPLVIQGLFSVFFLFLKIFCKEAQKFISLSTLLVNSSNDKLILLRSKWSSRFPVRIFQLFRYYNFVSSISWKPQNSGLFFFTFRGIRLIFNYYELCMMVQDYQRCKDSCRCRYWWIYYQ